MMRMTVASGRSARASSMGRRAGEISGGRVRAPRIACRSLVRVSMLRAWGGQATHIGKTRLELNSHAACTLQQPTQQGENAVVTGFD